MELRQYELGMKRLISESKASVMISGYIIFRQQREVVTLRFHLERKSKLPNRDYTSISNYAPISRHVKLYRTYGKDVCHP